MMPSTLPVPNVGGSGALGLGAWRKGGGRGVMKKSYIRIILGSDKIHFTTPSDPNCTRLHARTPT